MKATRILVLLVVLLSLTQCHVGRFIIYNFANLDDYKIFPSEEGVADVESFVFSRKYEDVFATDGMKKRFNNQDQETYFEETKTVAFMVIQNDSVLYEWYGNKYEKEDIVSSFSMSKSFISAMIGIALEEGKIKSLDEPITNYLKTFKNEGFEKITIQNLLDMRTGIDYVENYYNPFGNVAVGYYGLNLDHHVANLKIKKPADQSFEYISIATQLLGNIIEEATGESVTSYLEQKIWSKIGTANNFTWSLDRKGGRAKAFCCINGVAEDFAKFGRLFLNDGIYNDKQIIPKDWVTISTQLTKANKDNFYKNQWWLFGASDYSQPNKVDFCAQGHLGQFIYINPVKNTIIIRFGKGYGGVGWTNVFKEINKGL